MLRNLVASAAAVFAVASSANAALLTFNTLGNTGTETTEPSTSNDVGVGTSTLTIGAGVTPSANGNRFGGAGWTTTAAVADAVSGNDYIEFIVTPSADFQYTPTDLTFIWDRSSTGPSALSLRSSVDGFAADLGTLTGLPASNQSATSTIAIGGLTNLTTATTFRLYGYGAGAATGTGGFDTFATNGVPNNVVLNGTASAVGVPEPTTLALVGLAGIAGLRRRR